MVYVMVRALKSGEEGSVYLVQDSTTGEYYAAKYFNDTDNRNHVLNLHLFLRHDSIIRCYGEGLVYFKEENKSFLCLIFDYYHLSLEDLINKGLEYDQKELFKTLLSFLKYFNEKGYVHRDLRDSNIMYDYVSKKFVVIDFGFVCKVDTFYKSSYVMTLAENKYRIIQNGSKFVANHDIYSFGLILSVLDLDERYDLIISNCLFNVDMDIGMLEDLFEGLFIF